MREMVLKCKSCGEFFDSTFTSEEIALLPQKQYEAGTLHLCPHCGKISMYRFVEYSEKSD